MYIKTRNIRIKEKELEAFIVQGNCITFYLVSGTEITVDYETEDKVKNALQCLDNILHQA